VPPLNICYVGPAASVTMRRWAGWFAGRGHRITICTVEPADPGFIQGFRQVDLRTRGLGRKAGRICSAWRLLRALRGIRPDVVHVHYARGLSWGLVLGCPAPTVATPWGSDVLADQGGCRDPMSRWLTRRLFRQAALLTVHSEYLEAHVRALVPDSGPIARIGWGVDLRRFRPGLDVQPLRERYGIAPGQPVIFSPRLAQSFYRHDRVIRALPVVREKVDALLVIPLCFPERAYVNWLERLARELGVLEAVRFIPPIDYEEMPLWLNLAEVVVMVPGSDGMPNTLWEAMACGAVPLLNRLPQYGGVIRHGVNGCLVDPDGDLSGALTGLLADPVLRQSMAEHNRALVRAQGDQDREMARMEEWYYALAGRERSKK
jgi:glycosyltransferase involved in cell wall biosynthesis